MLDDFCLTAAALGKERWLISSSLPFSPYAIRFLPLVGCRSPT